MSTIIEILFLKMFSFASNSKMCVNSSCQLLTKLKSPLLQTAIEMSLMLGLWILMMMITFYIVPHNSDISTEIPRSGITELTFRNESSVWDSSQKYFYHKIIDTINKAIYHLIIQQSTLHTAGLAFCITLSPHWV